MMPLQNCSRAVHSLAMPLQRVMTRSALPPYKRTILPEAQSSKNHHNRGRPAPAPTLQMRQRHNLIGMWAAVPLSARKSGNDRAATWPQANQVAPGALAAPQKQEAVFCLASRRQRCPGCPQSRRPWAAWEAGGSRCPGRPPPEAGGNTSCLANRQRQHAEPQPVPREP